jgi:hypothetical protein
MWVFLLFCFCWIRSDFQKNIQHQIVCLSVFFVSFLNSVGFPKTIEPQKTWKTICYVVVFVVLIVQSLGSVPNAEISEHPWQNQRFRPKCIKVVSKTNVLNWNQRMSLPKSMQLAVSMWRSQTAHWMNSEITFLLGLATQLRTKTVYEKTTKCSVQTSW